MRDVAGAVPVRGVRHRLVKVMVRAALPPAGGSSGRLRAWRPWQVRWLPGMRKRGEAMAKGKAAGIVLAFALFAAVCAGLALGASALVPEAGLPQPIAADSPCPATGCADGRCHDYESVPEPDGATLMTCPESPCTSEECHGWDVLADRYHKASDASLNLWVVLPVLLVMGLVVVVKRVR